MFEIQSRVVKPPDRSVVFHREIDWSPVPFDFEVVPVEVGGNEPTLSTSLVASSPAPGNQGLSIDPNILALDEARLGEEAASLAGRQLNSDVLRGYYVAIKNDNTMVPDLLAPICWAVHTLSPEGDATKLDSFVNGASLLYRLVDVARESGAPYLSEGYEEARECRNRLINNLPGLARAGASLLVSQPALNSAFERARSGLLGPVSEDIVRFGGSMALLGLVAAAYYETPLTQSLHHLFKSH